MQVICQALFILLFLHRIVYRTIALLSSELKKIT